MSEAIRGARQARSQATHDAILKATLAVVGEQGPDAFTLADVVARAGCTTGAVYGRFRDKEALLLALYEHLVERWREGLRSAFAKWTDTRTPLHDAMRKLIAAQIATRKKEWKLRNAFLARILERPDFRRISATLIAETADLMADALATRAAFRNIPRRELQRRTGFAAVVIGATIERAITLRPAAPDHLPLTDAALTEALATAAVAILTTS